MSRPMSVRTLLEGWCGQVPDLTVSGLCLDAHAVAPGQAFVAVAGSGGHGMADALQAEQRGAALLIHDGLADIPALSLPQVAVPALGERLARLGARFYHNPSDQLLLAGVSGACGKTATAHYIAQSWQRTSGDAGIIGGIGCGPLGALKSAGVHEHDPITLQARLAECIDQGVEKLAMEVSSDDLEQGRVDDMAFDVAVFTSMSRNHLDYHGSLEAYEAARRRLFVDCHPRFAVIDHDDPAGKALARMINNGTQVLTYGTNGSTELRGSVMAMDSSGMTLSIASPWGGGEIQTGLMGGFKLGNLLAAAGTLALLGMPWSQVMHQMEIMHPVPGRMHSLGGETGQPVVVLDNAHTPQALREVLQDLRSHLHGRLVCVFGCGSARDSAQRAQMAREAEALADRLVMTTDGACDDAPFAVFADMMKGLERPGDAVLVEDRAQAIRRAVAGSGPGDIVLVAGKGHDAWQEDTVRDVLEDAA